MNINLRGSRTSSCAVSSHCKIFLVIFTNAIFPLSRVEIRSEKYSFEIICMRITFLSGCFEKQRILSAKGGKQVVSPKVG